MPNSPRARLAQRMPWLFSPRQWFGDVLSRPVRIERRGLNLHLVLGPRPQPSVEDQRDAGSGLALRKAHRELSNLLSRHHASTRTLPHLAYIERALRRKGSGAIPEMPLSVLHRALTQLNSVAGDATGEGLVELRRRIGLAIEARTREPGSTPLAATAAADDRDIDISEASHSLFEEMERSWTGQIPQRS